MYWLFVILVSIEFGACHSPLSDSNYAKCPAAGGKKAIADVESKSELEAIEAEKPLPSCERLSYDDDARILLDQAASAGNSATAKAKYDQAAEIMAKLVVFYPDEYERFGRLAASYAGAAGVELASFLKAMSQSSGGIFEMGKETLSSPTDSSYEADKENLKLAVTWIDKKISDEGKQTTSTGDSLQATVYRMAETLVIANGFLVKSADGTWDQAAIDNLSPDDVDAIINNLDTIAAEIPDPAAKAKVAAFQNSSQISDDEKKALIKKALASR
jgi:hypothetical protein